MPELNKPSSHTCHWSTQSESMQITVSNICWNAFSPNYCIFIFAFLPDVSNIFIHKIQLKFYIQSLGINCLKENLLGIVLTKVCLLALHSNKVNLGRRVKSVSSPVVSPSTSTSLDYISVRDITKLFVWFYVFRNMSHLSSCG
jgi:hypothetical protein